MVADLTGLPVTNSSLLDLTTKGPRRVSGLVHFFAVVFVLRYVLL